MNKKTKYIIYAVVMTVSALITHFAIASIADAAMDSTNYKIWLDKVGSGAGGPDVSTTNYKMLGNVLEHTADIASSGNYSEIPGFGPIDSGEPTVGFAVQDTSVDFGVLTPVTTATATHTFSAYTNSNAGYQIKVIGDSMNNANYTISGIGSTAASSSAGTEQFGINLKDNASPDIGAEPAGGNGAPTATYGTLDKFAFTNGDVIAEATSFSNQTNFTVSVILNIAEDSPAGYYTTELTYEFIPTF